MRPFLHVLSRYPNIKRVIINDINDNLMACYRTIKNNPLGLISALTTLQYEYKECGSEKARLSMYLSKRDLYNKQVSSLVDTVALFIFLNRTCFNGLYRVNSRGLFNVAFGKVKNPLLCDVETIVADSKLLQRVEIHAEDFSSIMESVDNDAFLFLDPPYRPLTRSACFTAYSTQGFGDDEQRILADLCHKLDQRGTRWMLTNSDPHNIDPNDMFFENLYAGFDIRRLYANRMINSKADGRGKITELVIRNYS